MDINLRCIASQKTNKNNDLYLSWTGTFFLGISQQNLLKMCIQSPHMQKARSD